jgi:hypothetical protein
MAQLFWNLVGAGVFDASGKNWGWLRADESLLTLRRLSFAPHPAAFG